MPFPAYKTTFHLMLDNSNKTTGVILSCGLARRMNYQDKGLIKFNGQPMISYAISAMKPIVDRLIINANRNINLYQQFGLPIIRDKTDDYDGPLAGILTAMEHADTPNLLVIPCDSPLITSYHLQKLLSALSKQTADVAVAFDGERLHPVFLAVKTALHANLKHHLIGNERKVELWIKKQNMITVDFSKNPECFLNINTLLELAELEAGITAFQK